MLRIKEVINNRVNAIATTDEVVGGTMQGVATDIGWLSEENIHYLVAQGILIVTHGNEVGIRGGKGDSRLHRWAAFGFVEADFRQREGRSDRNTLITRMREAKVDILSLGSRLYAEIAKNSKTRRKQEIEFDW